MVKARSNLFQHVSSPGRFELRRMAKVKGKEEQSTSYGT
jgi:hypothetical protein